MTVPHKAFNAYVGKGYGRNWRGLICVPPGKVEGWFRMCLTYPPYIADKAQLRFFHHKGCYRFDWPTEESLEIRGYPESRAECIGLEYPFIYVDTDEAPKHIVEWLKLMLRRPSPPPSRTTYPLMFGYYSIGLDSDDDYYGADMEEIWPEGYTPDE